MRICSILFPVITAGSAIALAASAGSTTRVMMIVRIDARTGTIAAAIRVGHTPAGLAVGGGHVWVAVQT